MFSSTSMVGFNFGVVELLHQKLEDNLTIETTK